jgi:hypothetical protein
MIMLLFFVIAPSFLTYCVHITLWVSLLCLFFLLMVFLQCSSVPVKLVFSSVCFYESFWAFLFLVLNTYIYIYNLCVCVLFLLAVVALSSFVFSQYVLYR